MEAPPLQAGLAAETGRPRPVEPACYNRLSRPGTIMAGLAGALIDLDRLVRSQ